MARGNAAMNKSESAQYLQKTMLQWLSDLPIRWVTTGDRITRPAVTMLMSSKLHRAIFRFASKWQPKLWDGCVIGLFTICMIAFVKLSGEKVPWMPLYAIITTAALFWLALGKFYIPVRHVPSISVVTEGAGKVSLPRSSIKRASIDDARNSLYMPIVRNRPH